MRIVFGQGALKLRDLGTISNGGTQRKEQLTLSCSFSVDAKTSRLPCMQLKSPSGHTSAQPLRRPIADQFTVPIFACRHVQFEHGNCLSHFAFNLLHSAQLFF